MCTVSGWRYAGDAPRRSHCFTANIVRINKKVIVGVKKENGPEELLKMMAKTVAFELVNPKTAWSPVDGRVS
jgi:hypothetical protein